MLYSRNPLTCCLGLGVHPNVAGTCSNTRVRRWFAFALVLSALSGFVGWAADGPVDSRPAADGCQSAAVAQVGERTIRETDLDRYIGRDAFVIEQKLYSLRRQALTNMIDSLLLRQEAEKQGVTEGDLLNRAVGNVAPASRLDIERGWVQDYEPLRQLGEVIGQYRVALDREDHVRTEAVRRYLQTLEEKAGVRIELREPEFRLRARPASSRLGQPEATVVLTVFLDYECPFCIRLEELLKDLLQQEPTRSRLRIDVKQFPLGIHRTAFESAVAAVCATEQKKFADYHGLLFSQKDHSPGGLLRIAEGAGLNVEEFRTCLGSDSVQQAVVADMREGVENGVQGTPTLFLDGVQLDRTENAEEMRRVIVSAVQHPAVTGAPKPIRVE
jgi:hypothetical protein